VESLKHLGHQAILDGEIVVLDREGRAQFQLLQGYRKSGPGTLFYKVFDLLYLDGHELRKLPLLRRKELLGPLIKYLPNILVSDHLQEHGRAFFEAIAARRLEGVVAKDGRSPYQAGVRSKSWLKIKTQLRQEAVIGGFTEQKNSRLGLGALLLGVYENERFTYIGHVGTGFSEKDLIRLRAQLEAVTQHACPFSKRPKCNGVARWVQPKFVCEVSFGEWTKGGHLRHPVFHGLRDGADPKNTRRQSSRPEESKTQVQKSSGPIASTSKPSPSKHSATSLILGGHSVQLTNLEKVYWPEEGFTKGDLIAYYRETSEIILPYLKDRPQSLRRHPNGIAGKEFFQRDVRQQPPPLWVRTVETVSEGNEKSLTLLCQDEATLIYLSNLGCIELNPWNVRIDALDRPDYVLLDLDPEDIPFERVVETAQTARKILEGLDVPVYCKTSGKRGLHLYIPFGARYSHEQAKDFALLIARLVHAKLPAFTSPVRDPLLRQGRVYLDYLQNGRGKTLACAYCVRPYKGATVSAPLKWTEVKKSLDPGRFTIRTMRKRLDAIGDIWRGVAGSGINLQECLERLATRLKKESI
jgi:bifunctional non-homologous end joining protein LigD